MILAVAAVMVAARVGDGGGAEAAAVLADARAAVEDAGTYSFSLTQGIEGATRGNSVTFRMTGSVDIKNNRTSMLFTSGGGPFAVNCTYVTDGEAFYTKVHETRRAEIGADWVRSELNRPFGVSGFQFTPEELYRDPEKVFTDLEEAGTADVRGVRTTTYDATLDLASVIPRFASPVPSAFPAGLPARLSVDEQGRLVRLVFEFAPTNATQATDALSFRSTMDLFDFGKPVDIEVPQGAKEGSPSEGATACYPSAALPNP